MKKYLSSIIFAFTAIVTLLLACNKYSSTHAGPSSDAITLTSTALAGTAEPNGFGLQGKYGFSNGDTVFRYGDFGPDGSLDIPAFLFISTPKVADSMAVAVLDENGDLAYMYVAHKGDSAKGRALIEFNAISDSELLVSLYDYDWTTNEAVMQKSIIHSIVNNKIQSKTLAGKMSGKIHIDRFESLQKSKFTAHFGKRGGHKSTSVGNTVWNLVNAIQGIAGTALAGVGFGLMAGVGTAALPALAFVAGAGCILAGALAGFDAIYSYIDHNSAVQTTQVDATAYDNQVYSFPGQDNSLPVTFNPVNSDNVSISFYDDGTVDGDIINVKVNGVDKGTYTLTADLQTINLPLNTGANTISITPVSEGTIPPCTAAVVVAYNGQDQTLNVSGYTGFVTTATIISD